MPQGNDQEKTEQPTSKKIADTRKKGQVASSKEIASAIILLTIITFFFFSGSWMFAAMSEFMRKVLENIDSLDLYSIDTSTAFFLKTFKTVFLIVAPLMTAILIAGILANIIQVGFLFTSDSLIPKFSKINPISGMKRLFSLKSFVELVKSILKILFVGTIAFAMVKGEIEIIPSLMHMGIGDILSFLGRVVFKICFYVCLALIVLAILDYVYQQWQHTQDLKMTKQEVKDESKQMEGDPQIKARIRKVQMEMSRRRMMESVPEADVVITNPSSLAIALKFDAKEMVAPQVTAKGAGFLADKIKQIAKENDVPIVENKPMAQTLFKMTEIGEFIPAELYRAVAEVLAYVYRLKGKTQ